MLAHRLGVNPNVLRTFPRTSTATRRPGAQSRRVLFEDVQREVTNDNLHRMLVESGIALGVLAVGSVGIGWVVAGRMLRPIHTITSAAQQLSDVNLHERIDLEGPADELKELADTFDAMLERLDRAFMSQQRFVADASHELRTPLAVIRTEVDVALADPHASAAELRAMGEVVRDATLRSEALVDGLLTLARTGAVPPDRTKPSTSPTSSARVVDRLAPDADSARARPRPEPGPGAGARRPGAAGTSGREPGRERARATTSTAGGSRSARAPTATPRRCGSRTAAGSVPPERVASLFERFRRLDDGGHEPASPQLRARPLDRRRGGAGPRRVRDGRGPTRRWAARRRDAPRRGGAGRSRRWRAAEPAAVRPRPSPARGWRTPSRAR